MRCAALLLRQSHRLSGSRAVQRGVQQLAAKAGQVVEVASTDYHSVNSGEKPTLGERLSGSRRKAQTSSDSTATRARELEEEDGLLLWKVQVVDLQLALLSTAKLGTAQFVADRCTLSQTLLSSCAVMRVRPAVCSTWRCSPRLRTSTFAFPE